MTCNHVHLTFNARTANPLRVDPTRTSGIRRKCMADMKRRFALLRKHVREFIDTLDALGLKEKRLGLQTLAMPHPRQFQFITDEQKLKAFNDWLKQQIDADILSVPEGDDPNQPWLSQYIYSSYKKGQINAYIAAHQADLLGESPDGRPPIDLAQAQFLQSAFNQPEALAKARLLSTRAFENLKGISSTVSSQLNQILAQGIIDGSGAVDIANEMVAKIDSLTFSRALTLARTELINAHSEGQLDAYEDIGIEELGLQVEWSTAGDDRVCPICSSHAGETLSVEDARGIIPIHPNCRCAWVPATSGLLRSLKNIASA